MVEAIVWGLSGEEIVKDAKKRLHLTDCRETTIIFVGKVRTSWNEGHRIIFECRANVV